MNIASKLQIKRGSFFGLFVLAAGIAAMTAVTARAQLTTQVIWDKWEGSNTFWGSVNQPNKYYPNAKPNQDITFGLTNSDEVRAASVSLLTTGKYAGYLEINVYTAFLNQQNGANEAWPLLGDLFLSTTGWNPYVPANPTSDQANHYTADVSGKGTRWNVAFDTPNIGYEDTLYKNGTYIATQKSGIHEDAKNNPMTYAYDTGAAGRLNQEVSWASGGKTMGDYVFEARHATQAEKKEFDLYGLVGRDWSVYSYIFDPKTLGLKDGQQIGLRWEPTCANDIIEGSFEYDLPKTPEPSTYALFGVFGLALVIAHRKWRGSKRATAP